MRQVTQVGLYMKPDPKTTDECKDRLALYFPLGVCNDAKVLAAVNDYMRTVSDPEFADIGYHWQDVMSAAYQAWLPLIHESGLNQIPFDNFDKMPSKPGGDDDNAMKDQDKLGKVSPVLTETDGERMEAICKYCAKEASKQTDVMRFREVCLGGRILTKEEYQQLVDSPGLGLFTVAELKTSGVSLASPSELIDCQEEEAGSFRYTVRFSAPDVVLTTVKRDRDFSSLANGTGWGINVPYVPSSVLYWLETLGNRLAKSLCWGKTDTYIFLVTGASPSYFDVGTTARNITLTSLGWPSGLYVPPVRAMIELRVPYWLTPGQVQSLYSGVAFPMQRRSKKESGHFKQSGRPPDAKAIRLFCYVEEQREQWGLPVSAVEWSDAQKRSFWEGWNEKCLTEKRAGDKYEELKLFMLAYKRAANYRVNLTGWSQEHKAGSEKQWREAEGAGSF